MASWLSRAGRQVSDTPRRHMRTRNRTMRDAPRHARESSVVRMCYAKDHDRLDASSDQASRRSVRVEPGRALRFTSEGKAHAAGIGDARVMTGGRQTYRSHSECGNAKASTFGPTDHIGLCTDDLPAVRNQERARYSGIARPFPIEPLLPGMDHLPGGGIHDNGLVIDDAVAVGARRRGNHRRRQRIHRDGTGQHHTDAR
jgi:hypothetical protein